MSVAVVYVVVVLCDLLGFLHKLSHLDTAENLANKIKLKAQEQQYFINTIFRT